MRGRDLDRIRLNQPEIHAIGGSAYRFHLSRSARSPGRNEQSRRRHSLRKLSDAHEAEAQQTRAGALGFKSAIGTASAIFR